MKAIVLWCVAAAASSQTESTQQVSLKPLVTITEAHSEIPNVLLFSPSGTSLLSAASDGSVKLWEVPSGKMLKSLSGHKDVITSAEFTPDGKQIFTSSWDGSVRKWEVGSGRQAAVSEHYRRVFSLKLIPGNNTLIAGLDEDVAVLGTSTLKEARRFRVDCLIKDKFGNPTLGLHCLATAKDGKKLAMGGTVSEIKIWDTKTMKELLSLKATTPSPRDRATVDRVLKDLAFSPDGKTLASCGNDTVIRLWDVNSGKELRCLTGHNDDVGQVSFAPSGKLLFSAGRTLRFWNVTDGGEVPVSVQGIPRVDTFACSPDGTILAVAGDVARSITLMTIGVATVTSEK